MASMTLDDLVTRLREAYGAGLEAVVLHGELAGAEGAVATTREALAVLVIVDALPVEALERAAPVVRDWVATGHPSPLTLTSAEWRSSADVFAMEYAEVLDSHRVLHGTLPLEGITVRPEQVRRELEEQVMGKLLKLRRGIQEAGADAARERTLLEVSLGTFLGLFRAVLRLHGERPPAEREALCLRTGELAGFDGTPFARVVRHVRGEGAQTLQSGDVRGVLAGYLAGLERLVAHLDRWTPGRG